MEKADLLKPEEEVTITVFGPDGATLYKSTGKGYHRVEEAVEQTVNEANLDTNPENCVFEIYNHSTGVSHRYRINAHGNLKLII